MSTTYSLTCNRKDCDRYQCVVISYGRDEEARCPGMARTIFGAPEPCEGPLLTDGEWDEIGQAAQEALFSDYHGGDAPQSCYDNAARRLHRHQPEKP